MLSLLRRLLPPFPISLGFWPWVLLGVLTTALWAGIPHGWLGGRLPGPESAIAQEQWDGPAEGDNSDDGSGESDSFSYQMPFEEAIEGLTRQDGLFTLYSDLDKGRALLAVRPEQLHRNYMAQATLESGVGDMGLFRGWPINDIVFQFRPGRNETLQIVVPNYYIRNPQGNPEQQRLLAGSFSDSVILGVDLVSTDAATGTMLIDLTPLLLYQDLVDMRGRLGWVLGDYGLNDLLSGIDSVKAFDENVEIGADLVMNREGGFSGFGMMLAGLADQRGLSLNLRFSFSQLPGNNGYHPRLADERVGYFLSTYRAPFQVGRGSQFVRYINRWHLEKEDPTAERSRPKEPIVFWIENTVPQEYRDAIREGILMWNPAFEQAGFENAIEVYQMPDNADWDPADVRYNVVRWSDALRPWALGLGPSRANPLTGQILDADIILDANTIRYLQQEYYSQGLDSSGLEGSASETQFYLQNCGQRTQQWYGQWLALQHQGQAPSRGRRPRSGATMTGDTPMADHFCAGYAARERMAFGSLALSTLSGANYDPAQLRTYIRQFLVHLTAHEVGHTLGLRHNFAGSLSLSPEELNDPAAIAQKGMASSVMDYIPPNIAAPGQTQQDFFPDVVGAYDHWAIEYGYRPFGASLGQRREQQGLTEILQRASTHPELTYAPDEDTWDFIDPEVDAWDLTTDPMAYANIQLGNAQAVWGRLNRWSVLPGEGYGSLRQRVNIVFSNFRSNAFTIANYIGGQRFRRVNPWDFDGRVPFEPIEPEKQRQALSLLKDKVFAADAFQFSPQLLNQLAPDRWWHWGTNLTVYPLDYPIYEQVLMTQGMILTELMYSDRLSRLRDGEFRTTNPDALTMAELYQTLHDSIWTEVINPGDAPRITSLRRGLQRHHLNHLTNLVLRRSWGDAFNAATFMDFMALISSIEAPEDARTLARFQLRQLNQEVQGALSRRGNLDITTRAHLEDVRDRIVQVLNAPLTGL